MFRSHSDHPQGARIFLIILNFFFLNVNISVVMRQRNIWCVYVHHTPPNRAHIHTPYVMLQHHYTNF